LLNSFHEGDAARRRGRGSIHPQLQIEEGAFSMKALSLVTKIAMPIVLLLLTAPIAAFAASADQLSSGSIEFSPTVAFSHQNFKRQGYGNVETSTRLDITPTVGFCVSRHYEVTGAFLTRHQSSNGNSDTALGASAGLTYNFNSAGQLIPFASVGFGALFYGGFALDETAVLAPMVTGGLRVLVGSTAAINMSLGYQHESNADGEFNASANRVIAGVGVSLFPWHTH
jgi:hypothetical protein